LATKELALTLPFSPGIFSPKNKMTIIPHTSYFTQFPRLKMNLRGCHFDTIEVIEAELQVVQNTLTEHDFHYAFKT
jgi:hypothetical protein